MILEAIFAALVDHFTNNMLCMKIRTAYDLMTIPDVMCLLTAFMKCSRDNAVGIMGQVMTILSEASSDGMPKVPKPYPILASAGTGRNSLNNLYNISVSAIAAVNKYVYTAVAKSTLHMTPAKRL